MRDAVNEKQIKNAIENMKMHLHNSKRQLINLIFTVNCFTLINFIFINYYNFLFSAAIHYFVQNEIIIKPIIHCRHCRHRRAVPFGNRSGMLVAALNIIYSASECRHSIPRCREVWGSAAFPFPLRRHQILLFAD